MLLAIRCSKPAISLIIWAPYLHLIKVATHTLLAPGTRGTIDTPRIRPTIITRIARRLTHSTTIATGQVLRIEADAISTMVLGNFLGETLGSIRQILATLFLFPANRRRLHGHTRNRLRCMRWRASCMIPPAGQTRQMTTRYDIMMTMMHYGEERSSAMSAEVT